MAHSRTYFPRSIKVGGKWKHWTAGSFIGNDAAAAKHVLELRIEHKAGNYSRVPKDGTVRRVGGNISVYV